MSVTTEILRSYRAPRDVMRRLLASMETDERPEARALVYLLLGCFIMFCSRLPGMLSADLSAPDAPPVQALVTITFFIMVTVWPLFFYLLAGGAHLIARSFGGKGTYTRSRLALSWTVLAVSPLMLLRGMVEEMIGPGKQLLAVDSLVALAFCALWAISLIEAETPPAA